MMQQHAYWMDSVLTHVSLTIHQPFAYEMSPVLHALPRTKPFDHAQSQQPQKIHSYLQSAQGYETRKCLRRDLL